MKTARRVEHINNQIWIRLKRCLVWFHKDYKGVGRVLTGYHARKPVYCYRLGFVSIKRYW